jgi:hypothetical protein
MVSPPRLFENLPVNQDKNGQPHSKDQSYFRGNMGGSVHGLVVGRNWSKMYFHLKFNIISNISGNHFGPRANLRPIYIFRL